MRRLKVTSCSVLRVPEHGPCRVDADQDILVENGLIEWIAGSRRG